MELAYIVEYPFARTEHDRDEIEHELVEAAGLQRLADRACPTCDVDETVAGSIRRFGKGNLEAVDEVEGRPTFHLDRVVRVMGQHEHRSVIRRLGTPPAAPIGIAPLAANGAEHVAAHDVGTT